MDKKSRGEQTREEILQAGARLFSLHGFFATGLTEILEDASISKGAFYHHFKSKEDLAVAVLDSLRADYERQVFAPVRQVADPAERLSFMFSRLVELNESGQWKNCLLLVRLSLEMAQSVGELSERIAEIVETLIRFWGELIREARTTDSIRDDVDPASLATLIHCTWLGAITCRELETPGFHLEEIAENLRGLIATGKP
jgi:TetR/AcrR family transcriptional regulator, transcriptional repressor for nem operon